MLMRTTSSRGSSTPPSVDAAAAVDPPRHDRRPATRSCWPTRPLTGVKTGHTLGAGYVLVGSARRDGIELISAVLGTPSEARPRRRDCRAARLRLLASTARVAGPAGRERSRDPTSTTAASSCRWSRGVGWRSAPATASGSRCAVERPTRSRGRSGAGSGWASALVLLDGRRVASVPLLASRGGGGGEHSRQGDRAVQAPDRWGRRCFS